MDHVVWVVVPEGALQLLRVRDVPADDRRLVRDTEDGLQRVVGANVEEDDVLAVREEFGGEERPDEADPAGDEVGV